MISNEIEALVNQRQKESKKKKRSQIPYAIILLILAAILCLFLWKTNNDYIVYWIIGIAIGITLRYSRFCFSGAFRDPFLMGNTKLFRGLLLALMISTVGFFIIQYNYLQNNTIILNYNSIPGSITSVGFHIMIGAFIFGIGMTIAGGCASGVLMKIGEGHSLQWIVLLGILIGNVLGAKDYSFWYDKIISKTKVIYLPEYIDFRVLVVIQLIILISLYKIASWYENKGLRHK